VLIGVEAVAGVHGGDHAVRLVDDVVDGRRDRDAAQALALSPGQHRLPAVALHAEVGRLIAAGQRVEEDRAATVVDDLRPLLAGGPARELGGDEDQARGGAGAGAQDGDRGRFEIAGRCRERRASGARLGLGGCVAQGGRGQQGDRGKG
jgi:hypothetical protein